MNVRCINAITNAALLYFSLSTCSLAFATDLQRVAKNLHVSDAPVINDRGKIAFESLAFGTRDVLFGTPEELTFSATDDKSEWQFHRLVPGDEVDGINRAGRVLYSLGSSFEPIVTSNGVQDVDGKVIRQYAARSSSSTAFGTLLRSVYSPFGRDKEINDSGKVAFFTGLIPGLDSDGLDFGTEDGIVIATPNINPDDTSHLSLIAKTDSAIPTTEFSIMNFHTTDFDFNNRDEVFFAVNLNDGTDIFAGTALVLGTKDGLEILSIFNKNATLEPDLFYARGTSLELKELAANDNGDVLFVASLTRRSDGRSESGGQGLFLRKAGGEPTLIYIEGQPAQDTGLSYVNFASLNINESGEIAFLASLKVELGGVAGDVVSNAIFAGAPGDEELVVMENELVDGAPIRAIEMSQNALNNSGQIVFNSSGPGGAPRAYITPFKPGRPPIPKIIVFFVNGIKTDFKSAGTQAFDLENILKNIQATTGRKGEVNVELKWNKDHYSAVEYLRVYQEKVREDLRNKVRLDYLLRWGGRGGVLGELIDEAARLLADIDVAREVFGSNHGEFIRKVSSDIANYSESNSEDKTLLVGYSEGTLLIDRLEVALRLRGFDLPSISVANLASEFTIGFNFTKYSRDIDDTVIQAMIDGCIALEIIGGAPCAFPARVNTFNRFSSDVPEEIIGHEFTEYYLNESYGSYELIKSQFDEILSSFE